MGISDSVENLVEEYQCPGCIIGSDVSCYFKSDHDSGCGRHIAGTSLSIAGKIFLGMPKGFNRLGDCNKTVLSIFESFESGWGFNELNVPVWKYLDGNGNTLVRGLSPRINAPFVHIFKGDCLEKIDCLEITNEDLEEMD